MLVPLMGALMERLGPQSVNALDIAPPAQADGLAGRVYQVMRREFFVAAPFALHAPVPELMAAAWALIRETLFVGQAPRSEKEILAWAVSEANRCPFCIDAHHAAVKATGGVDDKLKSCGLRTAQAQGPGLAELPFTEQRAEYLGTMVGFHYLNRMVSAFLDPRLMPVPDFMAAATAPMATLMMGGMVRKQAALAPGAALGLLPSYDTSLAFRPAWAQEVPSIAEAIAGWSGVIETMARAQLDAALLAKLGAAIETWQGQQDVAELTALCSGAAADQVPAVELALTVVAAPYRVQGALMQGVLGRALDQKQTLALVAWAAQRSARRVGTWVPAAAGLPV